jgi:hypothetical protein
LVAIFDQKLFSFSGGSCALGYQPFAQKIARFLLQLLTTLPPRFLWFGALQHPALDLLPACQHTTCRRRRE